MTHAAGSAPDLVRVDAHHHVWDLAVRPQPWTELYPVLARSFGIDDLRPELTAHRIAGTVLVQTVDVPPESAEMLRLASENPEILGVVGWVDLQAPDVAERIAQLRAAPGGDRLVGIRHQVQNENDPDWLTRPAVRRGLQATAAAGLAYDMLIRSHQLPAAVAAAQQVPELRIALDHCAKPPIANGNLQTWSRGIRQLSRSESVAVKLSGLPTEADPATWTARDIRPISRTVLEAFGADRVMFGSDWPACLPAASYSQIVALADDLLGELSHAEQLAVWAGTAVRWYGLTTPPSTEHSGNT